jgi:hypothetical protein
MGGVQTPEVDKTGAGAQEIPALQRPPMGTNSGSISQGGGLAPNLLTHHLDQARAVVEALFAAPLPTQGENLGSLYVKLGNAVSAAEAALLSALDALDPQTGGGTAIPAAPYEAIKEAAFWILNQAGEVFARIEPAFGRIVHGAGGWKSHPVEVHADRGDGIPLRHYRNTFKDNDADTVDERKAEYQERVDKFVAQGGRFEDLLLGNAETLANLEHRVRYDYVMLPSGLTRLYPTTQGKAKPGHSLLADGDAHFNDENVLLAGELWVLKDSAGEVEAVMVANNSGHFKPLYEDLSNALPVIKEWGLTKDQIVLFGGPNNLPAILSEIEERCQVSGLMDQMPNGPSEKLKAWGSQRSSLDVRLTGIAPD